MDKRAPRQAERFKASLTDDGRYRLLVEAITDYAIYMLDADGYVSSWNPGAQRFKGYTAEEIVGEHFSRFYTDEDRTSGLPAKALHAARTQGRFEGEGWRLRKDGTQFWVHVIIDPIRGSDGELVGYAKITRDLTERREAQVALERTREALVQSQKMEALGQLTGGVAHDFNNLLMVVMGGLELVRRRVHDDARLVTLVNNAFEGAERGVALTQRMLAFARRQELKIVSVDVRALANGMAELLDRTLGPSIIVETDIPSGLPSVKADANQLESALLNLAVNARDAMPKGGWIEIAARVEEIDMVLQGELRPGRYVCLSVKDEGEGMDAVTLARATEPFFTTKGVGKGTGLGLSMVHGMAEQMGGRLYLKSIKGQGSTAEIWLPVDDAIASGHVESTSKRVGRKASRSFKILAVDDDRLVLINTVAMLEELGHTVIEALSGHEALTRLRAADRVDLVITDQAMPRMTGHQLTQAIRKEWPDLPILLVSGYAELPEGVDIDLPRLSKPFSFVDLENAVGRLVAD